MGESKYYKEMANEIHTAIYSPESYTSEYVLAMSYATFAKICSIYGTTLVATQDGENYVNQLFGRRVYVTNDVKDGNVCLMKMKYEYEPSMEDWWEN